MRKKSHQMVEEVVDVFADDYLEDDMISEYVDTVVDICSDVKVEEKEISAEEDLKREKQEFELIRIKEQLKLEKARFRLEREKFKHSKEEDLKKTELDKAKVALEYAKINSEEKLKEKEIKKEKRNFFLSILTKAAELLIPLSINTALVMMNFRLIYADDGRTPSEMKDLMKNVYRK